MLLAEDWQLYCQRKELPWQIVPIFGSRLFIPEQVFNFISPGEGEDLKYLSQMFQFFPELKRKK